MARPQVWELVHEGHHHVLTATDAGLSRHLEWRVDDEVVAEKKSSDERLRLSHGQHALDVRFSLLGGGRRATLHTAASGSEASGRAELGVGGTDLVPEPGSGAARHEQWVRDHPRLHTLRETLGGAAGVAIGLLVAWLLARVAFSFDLPDIPWPDLPDIPWPDLPDIPWPDLPDLPLPSIPWPDWSVPAWVEEVLDALKLVVPVVLAFVVARAEIRRRRKQDELRDAEEAGDAQDPTQD